MLALEPEKRPSIEQIMSHPWMKGPLPTHEEVFFEFSKRSEYIKLQKE